MRRHLAVRAGQYVLVVAVALALNFALPRAMPGGPLAVLGGEDVARLGPQAQQELLAEYGLDRPLHEQFVSYVAGSLTGDLGISFADRRPVAERIAERLPWTLLLVGSSIVVTTVLGVALGALAAALRERRRDTGRLVAVLALDAAPPFWVGMLLVLLFGVQLGWLPTFGARTPGGGAADVVRHLALPLATLSLGGLAQTYLVTRSSMLSTLGGDHLLLARAKGLSRRRVLVRHGLRPALLPVHTLVLLELGWLVGGAVVVETVFSYPGVGQLMFEAVLARDYPVMQGAFFVLTLTVVGANALADLTYPLLDPRVRRAPAGSASRSASR